MKNSSEVALFIQCLVDSLYPHVGESMVSVLEEAGLHVTYPADQTCCGQPAFNSGYRREARAAAVRFIEIFEQFPTIVCPSGSCVHMVRHHYPELFQDDSSMLERSLAVGAKTFEFTEYLVDHLGLSSVENSFPHSVTYHDSCHLARGLNISQQPRLLLHNTHDLEFIEMVDSDTCCGFGGTFSINYADISTAMVDEKIDNILATGADVVCGSDISCLMNIEGRLSRRKEKTKVMHIAEILASKGAAF